ncbi:hypothetical protein M409DRAFT_21285 [Zasmidium cellare ATCC 36951]|uniref:Uncharacterized protein n=1 Tax=Zasmidium cellare ATCC 36951 TaxID=1080233 RepID=A0A6A6CN23_ZASCE|nr:uncharacterized protein M409DRAFT_21285 [Zasmidium cellare ATCC 36951]KAF2168535.1 hypothetical protein M409DRAFT_21285 [Zasmidium cellare ATCC 36951]
MPSQAVGKYLDRNKLKKRLEEKYGTKFDFNIVTSQSGTNWDYPDGHTGLSEDEIEQCQKDPPQA